MASFREEIVQMAILYSYCEFQEAALEVIPPGLAEYIGPHLPEIYMEVQEEVAADLAKYGRIHAHRKPLQSRCKSL